MKAALVVKAGQPPVYGDFKEPVPTPGKSVIRVTASSISHLTKSRASGTHYSSRSGLPFVPGIDGVGLTEAGERVYFAVPEHPFGGMAQLCLVDDRHRFPIPVGMDAEVAAAIAIPGMSSWAALVERAQVRVGETVLINGATGVSGRLAIQIAKHLGVKKVIATGRRVSEALRALGADVIVPLTDNQAALEEALEQVFRDGVDIVLDYLWGPSAQTLISAAAKASPEGIPIRYVEIGAVTASTIELPSAALRASGLKLMGSGIGSVALPQLLRAISGVLHAAPVAGFATAVQSMPLSEVTQAWASAQTDERIVLRP